MSEIHHQVVLTQRAAKCKFSGTQLKAGCILIESSHKKLLHVGMYLKNGLECLFWGKIYGFNTMYLTSVASRFTKRSLAAFIFPSDFAQNQ